MSSQPRIAIIGGGPAGLTTGLLLHKQGIPFTIFELRQKPTEEELAKPSGMLDLHDESGIAAIKECGLLDQFFKLTGECSEAQKVADKNGNIIYRDEGELSERPEISRHALSKLLIAHIPADHIKWGHKLLSASSSTTSGRTEIELNFGANGKQTFDLAIGADGAWSKIRNLLTGVKPNYAGTQNLTLTVREITKKHPHLAELVGLGSFSALGNRHGVMSQRGPQDSARIYIFLTTEDEHFPTTAGLEGQTAVVAGERIMSDSALIGTWGPTIKDLVTVACKEETLDNPSAAVDLRPLYNLPAGTAWEHKTGATIIGDAAHLMCPWAGEGVNLAMWDSLLLAHAITKAYETGGKDAASFQRTLDPLVAAFEVDMVARAKEKAEETIGNGQMMFGEDGANAFKNFFLTAYETIQKTA
ncbi:salicylate hydroxylase [Thelonectria olida]|uniref:Salicylate hydroxylase n=1 Tax=Thelonectria olida TaxID=1576542 RepID=A0A9P9ANX3_9HYPO|nr:salicylate hydroxylase [Thelonectria olida]